MSLIVVGLNHRTVPVELLERMTVPRASRCPRCSHDLAAREHLARGRRALDVQPHRDLRALHALPRRGRRRRATSSPAHSGADPDDFADHLYTYYDDAAVAHLFSVAAGLDSMIVGESEILGQVRDAWQAAVREGSRAAAAAALFRHAVESGKRVRTETGIGRHPVSIPSAAVAVAAEHLGTLEGATVLVIGAGQMGRGLASTLAVARRRARRGRQPHARARRSARRRRIGGEAVPLTDVADTLVDVDVAAHVDGVERGARRTRDGRDGDGVPRRPAAARSSTSRCRATSIPACARSTT